MSNWIKKNHSIIGKHAYSQFGFPVADQC